jgi:hypothetical protein
MDKVEIDWLALALAGSETVRLLFEAGLRLEGVGARGGGSKAHEASKDEKTTNQRTHVSCKSIS